MVIFQLIMLETMLSSFFTDWANGPYGWTLVVLIALFFTLLTVIFYYTRDKYEPEPISNIVKAFLFGVLSVIPAIILSLIVIQIVPVNQFALAIIIAPVVEEFCKGWMVVHMSHDDAFDGPLDGIIYGAMIGSGFATIENLIYALAASLTGIESSIQLTIIRSIPQAIGHPLYTGIFGAGIGAYKVGLSLNQYQHIWRSILLHAGWNTSASFINPATFFGGLITIATISIYILRKELRDALRLDKAALDNGY
ncbi:MAG: PrsW family intramembrane metalloprotease, partial [Candidatus Heimdallarchaeota archaeon]|nr:PrsW family intramembrane metalloprotease [Candidatus Heimdallarchaeota archaeon]